MTGLAGRIGKVTATTLLAGAMGGVALLAGEALAARGRRYAKPTMGLALRTSMGPTAAPSLRLVLIEGGFGWLAATKIEPDRAVEVAELLLAQPRLGEPKGPPLRSPPTTRRRCAADRRRGESPRQSHAWSDAAAGSDAE